MRRLIIFDLDGTVADTLADIVISLNTALASCGLPTLSDEAIKRIIGHSVAYMCENAVPAEAKDRYPAVLQAFNSYYHKHCCDHTRPYPGLVAALTTLKDRGYTLAVVSNKPHREAVKVMATLFDRLLFSLVLGRMDKFRIKPDPEPLLFAISALDMQVSDGIYVGDSEVDVEFAKNTGLPEIAVDWGYRSHAALLSAGAKHIVSGADGLLALILSGEVVE